MESTISNRRVHQGRNLKRLREARGIKQEYVANELGMTQQNISLYEAQQEIDEDMLRRLTAVIGIPVEIVKQMEDDLATYIIENNTFENGSSNIGSWNGDNGNGTQNNNPIEKVTELYERLLKSEQQRNEALLQEMAAMKQKYGEK